LPPATLSKGLPIQVDSLTQLIGVTGVGDTLSELQLKNMIAADVDSASVDAFQAQLAEHDCGNATLTNRLLRKGVVVRYRYVDAANAALTAVELTDAICGGVR
jgi:hypothetical protein